MTLGGMELGRRLGIQIMAAVMGGAIATLVGHNELLEALGPMGVFGVLFLLELPNVDSAQRMETELADHDIGAK